MRNEFVCVVCGSWFKTSYRHDRPIKTCGKECNIKLRRHGITKNNHNFDLINPIIIKDPESLFCDTEFLEKLMGKKPASAEECEES